MGSQVPPLPSVLTQGSGPAAPKVDWKSEWNQTDLGKPPPGFRPITKDDRQPRVPRNYDIAARLAWLILDLGIEKFAERDAKGQRKRSQLFPEVHGKGVEIPESVILQLGGKAGGPRYYGRLELHDHPPQGSYRGDVVLGPSIEPQGVVQWQADGSGNVQSPGPGAPDVTQRAGDMHGGPKSVSHGAPSAAGATQVGEMHVAPPTQMLS
jgi:hypothetical protein